MPDKLAKKDGAKLSDAQERVLQVAAKLFAERGFHAVSIRDIAAEGGVSVSTVLYQGGSKQGLLERVLAESFSVKTPLSALLSQLEASMIESREHLFEMYDQFVELLVEHALQYPDSRRLWIRLLLDQPELFKNFEKEQAWPLFQRTHEIISELISRGLVRMDRRHVMLFFSSIDWILDGFSFGGVVEENGERSDTRSPDSVANLVAYLKAYGRSQL